MQIVGQPVPPVDDEFHRIANAGSSSRRRIARGENYRREGMTPRNTVAPSLVLTIAAIPDILSVNPRCESEQESADED
jgi:hypothetical protein